MKFRVHFALSALVVAAALLLGGGTRHGLLSDVVLQLVTIPLIISSIAEFQSQADRHHVSRAALWLCLAAIAVPILQLLPFPPAIWTLLPGHSSARQSFEAAGVALPWLPISVSPQSTWMSLAGLLPPLAVFIAVLQLSRDERRQLSLLILAVGLAGVLLGLLQVAQGPSSSLRFYEYTNDTEAVGFFANRNHFAAFNLVLILLAAVWTFESAPTADAAKHARQWDGAKIMLSIAGFTVMVLLIAGQAMARSRAGLVLTIFALLGIVALAAFDHRRAEAMARTKVILGGIILAIIFSAQFAIYRIIDRLGSDPLQDSRFTFANNTFQALKAYAPFGSGMGTFVPVYATFEKPEDAISGIYVNHAHSDLLEILLEAGLFAALIGGALLIGFVRFGAKAWRPSAATKDPIDLNLARAASIAILLLLAHSLVDYPLRTSALAVVTAFAAAHLFAIAQSLRVEAHEPSSEFETYRRRMEAPVHRVKSGTVSPSPPPPVAPSPKARPAPQPHTTTTKCRLVRQTLGPRCRMARGLE